MDTLPNDTLALITSKLSTGAKTVCRGVCRRLCKLIDDNVRSVRVKGINWILPSSRYLAAKFPRAVALEIRDVRDGQLRDFLLANQAFLPQLEELTLYPPSMASRRWLMGWILASCINSQQPDLAARRLLHPHNDTDKPDPSSAALSASAGLSGLRTLDLWQWHIRVPARDFAALVAFTNLSSLTFSCAGLHAEDLQLLSTLGHLNHLIMGYVSSLRGEDSVNQVLRAAALVTPLRHLELQDTNELQQIGEASIEADNPPVFDSFQNLEQLHIEGFALVDLMLLFRGLLSVTTLNTLTISNEEYYADIETGFSEMKHVLHLSMDWMNEMPGPSFLQACRDKLPSLNSLELHTTRALDAVQIGVVTTLTRLTLLALHTIDWDGLDTLEAPLARLLHHMTGLRVLRCTAVLDEAALTSLASMPVLEELIVHEVLPLVQLLQRQFSSLRTFGFSKCIAGDESALMLCDVMPHLRALSADWLHLSANGLRQVGLALPRLTSLRLHGMAKCEPWGFETTAELRHLVELYLHDCQTLTLSAVESILRRRYLDKLDIFGCPLISKDALRAVLLQYGRADLAYTV